MQNIYVLEVNLKIIVAKRKCKLYRSAPLVCNKLHASARTEPNVDTFMSRFKAYIYREIVI